MQRLFILGIVAVLSFSPLGGFFASGQEPDPYWNGVSAPEVIEGTVPLEEFLVGVPLETPIDSRNRSVSTRLPQGYRINFETLDPDNRPQIPELPNTEYMVVIVESGQFVLNVLSSPAFVVDPPEGQSIRYMFAEGDFEVSFAYTASDHVVLDENNQPCTDLCTVLPPTEFPPAPYPPSESASPPDGPSARAVLLEEGYRVEGLAKNFCIWCLVNSGTGSLLVYPSVKPGQEFSWLSAYNEAHGLVSPEGAEFVQGDPGSSDTEPVRMSWMFNPGGRCN